MFQKGELVVYSGMGVCRVADVTMMDMAGDGTKRSYYLLEPIYRAGMIYAPTDSSAHMRPVISEADAVRLIDSMPGVRARTYEGYAPRELAEQYETALRRYDCADLVALSISIYEKKREREKNHQKFAQADETYMKRAEELLFGELAAALNVAREDVPDYIARRLEQAENVEGKRLEAGE